MLERLTVADITPVLLDINSIEIKPTRTTLASGRKSCIYFNVGDQIITYPREKNRIVEALAQTYDDMHDEKGIIAKRLLGVPEGMNILTSSLTDLLGIGQLRVRERLAEHGEQRSLEGNFQEGQEVVIFEDVMTTGKSTLERAIKPVQSNGLKPAGVITLIDRQFGGVEMIKNEHHIPTYAFTNTTEIAKELVRTSALGDKQLRLLKEELDEIKAAKQAK